jgi:cytochrome c-type biogenesis protein CcmE
LIQEGSIAYDSANLLLTFQISDETGTLPVIYKGVRPDMFQEGAEAVVEGHYETDGRFKATSLMLKCPSKYEESTSTEEAGA